MKIFFILPVLAICTLLLSVQASALGNNCYAGYSRCTFQFETTGLPGYSSAVLPCNLGVTNTDGSHPWCQAGQSSTNCNIQLCREGCTDDILAFTPIAHCNENLPTECKKCTPNSWFCDASGAATHCVWNSLTSCWQAGLSVADRQFCQYGCVEGQCLPAPVQTCTSQCQSSNQYSCQSDGGGGQQLVQCTKSADGCMRYTPNIGSGQSCAFGCSDFGNGNAQCNPAPVSCPETCTTGQTRFEGTYIYTCIQDPSKTTCNKWCTSPSDCSSWYFDAFTNTTRGGIIECQFGAYYDAGTGRYRCAGLFNSSLSNPAELNGYISSNPKTFMTNLSALLPGQTQIGFTEAWAVGGWNYKYLYGGLMTNITPFIRVGAINSDGSLGQGIIKYLGNITQNGFSDGVPVQYQGTLDDMFYDGNYLWTLTTNGVAFSNNKFFAWYPNNMSYAGLWFGDVKGFGAVYKDNAMYLINNTAPIYGYNYYNMTFRYNLNSSGTYHYDQQNYTFGRQDIFISQLIWDSSTNQWYGAGCINQICGNIDTVSILYENFTIKSKLNILEFSPSGLVPLAITFNNNYFLVENSTDNFDYSGSTPGSLYLMNKQGNLITDECPPPRTSSTGVITHASRCAGANYMTSTGFVFPQTFTEIQYCTKDTTNPAAHYTWNGDKTFPLGQTCILGCIKLWLDNADPYAPTICNVLPPPYICTDEPGCNNINQDISCINGWYRICKGYTYNGITCKRFDTNLTRCPSGACTNNKACFTLRGECQIGEQFCISLPGSSGGFVAGCYYNAARGMNMVCDQSTPGLTKCNVSLCTTDEYCDQSFNQSSNFTTARCTSLALNKSGDIISFANWLDEMGIGFRDNSQVSIIATNSFGEVIFFIILTLVVTGVGFFLSQNIYGGMGAGVAVMMIGFWVGWLPPVIMAVMLIGMALIMWQLIFGRSDA